MIIWRHILARHAAPFAFASFVLMFVFLLQFLVKSLDQLAGKGLAPAVIAELIVLSLAWMVVLAIPMAVLVATLMAFGQLASTNQITALRASGMSLYRMIAPVLAASVVVCLLLIRFNNDVLPDANHRTKILLNDISRKKPTISIVPGMFSQLMPGHTILVRKTFEQSNDLEGVTIFDYSAPSVMTTITGARGTISFSPDYRKLIMDLSDGEIHEQGNRDGKQYRRIRFARHRIAMDAEGFDFQRSAEGTFGRGDRELSAQSMRSIVDSLSRVRESSLGRLQEALEKQVGAQIDPAKPPGIAGAVDRAAMLKAALNSEETYASYMRMEMNKYEVEIYKKYAIPFACIVFVLIGAPLGIMARRGTFGAGASLSLGFFLLYWTALIQGERLADRGIIDPMLAMWLANAVIGLLGVYLTVLTARESLTLDLSWMQRLVPRSWRGGVA
ncbi:MAG: LptF/LptG family permease, partial [Bacteroidota bacterium]